MKKASSVSDLWEDELQAETESIHSHNPYVYDYLSDTAKPGWGQEENETLREMRLSMGTERQRRSMEEKKEEFVTDMVQTLQKQYSRSSLVAAGGGWAMGDGCGKSKAVCAISCYFLTMHSFHSQFRHQYWSESGGSTFFTPEFGLRQSLWKFSVQHR